jgi:phenylacetate-CoA ligase
LRALLRHTYQTVPFYRRRFDDAGFHPDQFRTLDDLRRVPITTKNDLRAAAESDAIAADCDPGRLIRYGTGGSTGAPTEVRFTWFEDRLLRLLRLDVIHRYGLRLRDLRCAVVYFPGPHRTGLMERLGILRYRAIHAFQPRNAIREALLKERPDVIRGYPSALSSLIEILSEEDRALIRPRWISTDSEKLTDLARTRIEAAFGAPVFDIYDCFECNVIAHQCPKSNHYHVLDSSVVAEVLHEGIPVLPGESGELAFTSLHAWAAPLIRYMPGDLVQQGPSHCKCGAPNSCLSEVYGRTHDLFVLPSGRIIHPKIFAVGIYPLCPYLSRYQIVQDAAASIVVKLQPSAGVRLPPEQLETARSRMTRELAEDGVSLRIEVVDEIPSESNGKFRPYRAASAV